MKLITSSGKQSAASSAATVSTSQFKLILDNENKQALLEIQQDTGFRTVTILKLVFSQTQEERLKMAIQYRFSSMKQKTFMTQERIRVLMDIVQDKNPILLDEIYKSMNNSIKAP